MGILLVTVTAIIVGTFAKDFFRFLVALSWKCPVLFKPNVLGLLLAVVCIFLSRALEVTPGYIFGLAIGLFIYSERFKKNEGRLEFFGLFWMLLLAIGAWLLVPILKPYPVLSDLMILLFVILIEGVFFEAMPLSYLPGYPIFTWNKWLWGFFFGSVTFLLFHTLFNPNSSLAALSNSAPTRITLMILGAYGVLNLGLWAWLMRRKGG